MTDYEVGYKGTFLGGHLRTQIGGYYSEYKNHEINIVDLVNPGISSIFNVPGKTKLYGAELSAQSSFRQFSFDLATSLSNSELGRFFAADPRLGNSATLTPRIDYAHIDSAFASLFQNVAFGDKLEARDIVNAQLTLATGEWSIVGYGTNLTDQHYVAAVNGLRRLAGAPRQYGVRVSRSFWRGHGRGR